MRCVYRRERATREVAGNFPGQAVAAASEGDEGERRDGGRSFFISSF